MSYLTIEDAIRTSLETALRSSSSQLERCNHTTMLLAGMQFAAEVMAAVHEDLGHVPAVLNELKTTVARLLTETLATNLVDGKHIRFVAIAGTLPCTVDLGACSTTARLLNGSPELVFENGENSPCFVSGFGNVQNLMRVVNGLLAAASTPGEPACH